MAGMENSFFIEFLGLAWDSFLSAIGTTGLGLFASSFALFFMLEVATWVVIWVVRGKDAMMAHKKENFIIGAAAYILAMLTIYVPIYVGQMRKVDSAIWNEASSQSIPQGISRCPAPPAFAEELSPASITLSLVPQNFSFDLGGPYKLEDKRQYLLTFENSTHNLSAADLELRFPYPVEAKRVIRVRGIHEFTFDPTRPLLNLIGAKLEDNGCLGRWSYNLHVVDAQGKSRGEISLILNTHSASHPLAQGTIHQGNGYIVGFFVYRYLSQTIKRGYYAELSPTQEMTVKVADPQSQPPTGFKKSSGFTVLDGPCIPDSSLMAP
jgi:hypothetical protein